MAKGRSSRLATHVVWVTLAFLLPSVGIAYAGSGHGHGKGHHHGRKLARLSDARALVGPNRCVARNRLKRVNPAGVRRRCGRRPARASHAPQPLYWGATI